MAAQADGYGSNSAEAPDFSDVPDLLPYRHRALTPLRFAPAPTLADVRGGRRLALLVVMGWAVAQAAALGLRFDWDKLPFSYVAATLLLPLALGLWGLFSAVHSGPLGLGAPRALSVALVVLGPLSVIGTALLLPEPYAGGLDGGGRSIFMCGNLALGWAAVPLLAAALALKHTFAAGAVWRSAAVGTACGVGAAVAAQLRCPVTGAWHIVFAHGSAVVIFALLGALLLPRATQA